MRRHPSYQGALLEPREHRRDAVVLSLRRH
jgi:hypothetical protein